MTPVIEWGGEAIELRPERAALLRGHRTLLVADVHFGKARAFRQQGVPVPGGTTRETLARLDALVRATAAERVVFLGDLLHSRHAQGSAALEEFARWRAGHRALGLTLVRGNHDAHAGDPPAALGIEAVDEPFALGALALCHHPSARPPRRAAMPPATGAPMRAPQPGLRSFMDDAIERPGPDDAPPPSARARTRAPRPAPALALPRIAGHEHPCIGLHGRTDSLRLPCFHFGADVAVLPAFGAFAGMHAVRRAAGDRVWAILDDRVVEVPAR
jgi:DNA ligase-associated metallophosphoesterase